MPEYLAPKQGMRCYQLRYYTTLIATELVIVALRKYLSGTLKSAKQEKIGRYYSFMPKDLKKLLPDNLINTAKILVDNGREQIFILFSWFP